MYCPGKRQSLSAPGSVLLIAILLAGCGADRDEKIAELTKLNQSANAKIDALNRETSAKQELQEELDLTKTRLQDLKRQLERSEAAGEIAQEQQETLGGLLDSLKRMIESGDLEVRIRGGRMVIALPSAVLFKSGEADLSEKGEETLAGVADVFKGIKDRQFQVAGHTDNVPLGKDNPYESNWHLSAARAVAVVQFLVKKGLPAKSLSAAGYAHYQPVASNKTKRGKALNRRIEISLMPNLKELPDLSKLERAFGLAEPPPDDSY